MPAVHKLQRAWVVRLCGVRLPPALLLSTVVVGFVTVVTMFCCVPRAGAFRSSMLTTPTTPTKQLTRQFTAPATTNPMLHQKSRWYDIQTGGGGGVARQWRQRRQWHWHLSVHSMREADLVEALVGGERYSLVPMPDSMKATTLFVGNLCEFVNDADLSTLFAQASSLLTVPSCVVRKVNTQSMGYGFVSFPSIDEKEVSLFVSLYSRSIQNRSIEIGFLGPFRDSRCMSSVLVL